MNKKLWLLFIFVIGSTYAQVAEVESSEVEIDVNKINGTTPVPDDKSLLANIDSKMKSMEDGILKLMRDLGELKMQVQTLKSKQRNDNSMSADFTATTTNSSN